MYPRLEDPAGVLSYGGPHGPVCGALGTADAGEYPRVQGASPCTAAPPADGRVTEMLPSLRECSAELFAKAPKS